MLKIVVFVTVIGPDVYDVGNVVDVPVVLIVSFVLCPVQCGNHAVIVILGVVLVLVVTDCALEVIIPSLVLISEQYSFFD